ncbi:hypothetical protein GT3921_17590 [Geobacillus thermocatenulatus]|nr:hypothetical protein [Geobacillus thermocatenulatus]AST00659.1 hypothetical protein GT3921_17590 [Geobacillus thermocatenulatus]
MLAMRYKAYRKLYRISVEEKKGDSSQKVIIQNILIVLFWSLIFFVCFVTFQMDPNKFSFYYCLLYLILELLLLFSVIHLYESSQFIINFLRNVPITENKIFYFHYIASGWSLNYVTELITIVVYLALFKAKWINIVLLLIGIATIKLLRTYLEFLLVLLKNHQKRFPIWTIAFFFLTLCLYTIVPKGYFSNFQWTFSFFIFILSVASFFAIVTYRIIIKALLKGNFSLENFVWFNKFTNSLSEFATTIFRFNRVFQKLVKVQLIRMIRSPEYVQKLLTIGIMYFIFSLVSDLVIDKAMGESPNESLSNLLYTAFLISFLSFSNITLDLTFRTLPTKIGRIFSSRCRIGPWYTRKAKEFPHHGRSNSCYL